MAIPIPASAKVKRDTKSEAELLASSRAWLEGQDKARAGGLHASHLLNPMKGYWQTVDPKGLTDREVTIFLVGKVLHGFVLGAMEGAVDIGKTDSGSSYAPDLDIWYSPDWDKSDIAEFKTARNFKEPESIEELSSYLEQLLIYMVAKNVASSRLWVLYVNLRDLETGRTHPVFRCYRFSISAADLAATRAHVTQTAVALKEAVATKDPSKLALCWQFICGEQCPWWDKCAPPGRYGVDRRRWSKDG